jgi:flagellar assembly protein FliH
MSLSKIFKNSASFVPEQILPHQESPSEPVWQDLLDGHSTVNEHQDTFVPDNSAGYQIIADKKPFTPPNELADLENTVSSEHASKTEEMRKEPVVPAMDPELIRKKAFGEGVLEGRRQADKDFGSCAQTLLSACNQLTNLHETILRNNLDEMHSLVMEIAEKIIRHSLHDQSETILATIEDAIHLAVKSEEFQIRVNPEDLEVIKQKKNEIIEEISGLDNIVLKADRSVERGGCLLESVNCTVDATITSQLQVIKEALQSTPESAPAAAAFPGEP